MCEVCTELQWLQEGYGEGPLVLEAMVVEWRESPYLQPMWPAFDSGLVLYGG